MDNEEVPYRSPVDIQEEPEVPQQDEEDFSTLLYIQKEFNREMRNLHSIDILDLKEGGDGLSIAEQVHAYRKAKDILEPLQTLVNTRIDEIKGKQKRGSNG